MSYYHNSSCDTAMTKPSHYSYEQWESKKYCSRKCGARSPLHQNFTVGHKHSQETKKKLSEHKIGEKNPMWKGGRFGHRHSPETIDKIKKARNKRV